MENASDLISKIQASTKPSDIFTISSYKADYYEIVKVIHPDVCHLPFANEALTKLNHYKHQIENPVQIEDDAGFFKVYEDKKIVFEGEKALLEDSFRNYSKLYSLSDPGSQHFKKYLPKTAELIDGKLTFSFPERAVPLVGLELPEHHVSWILSRVYELVAWFHQVGYVHNAILPETILVVPETHGIICTSFYHMAKQDSKLGSVSGRYLNWYPQIVFDNKISIPYIDTSLAQRLALYLLGDRSGNGVKLKNVVNVDLIDFLITPHYQAMQTYDEYRKLLSKIYGRPTFHTLNL